MIRILSRLSIVGLTIASVIHGDLRGESGADENPVLTYYQQSASETHENTSPFLHSLPFSVMVKARYYSLDGAKSYLVDSSEFVVKISSGGAVTREVRVSSGRKSQRVDLSWPNVFQERMTCQFFPNDTGGPTLAIGFESPLDDDSLPVGVAIIERESKRLVTIYMYFPAKEGYRRFSRSITFANHGEFVFPEKITEIGVRDGLLGSETYRLEMSCRDFTLLGY